jgi:hypothetical protein
MMAASMDPFGTLRAQIALRQVPQNVNAKVVAQPEVLIPRDTAPGTARRAGSTDAGVRSRRVIAVRSSAVAGANRGGSVTVMSTCRRDHAPNLVS